MIFKNNTVTNRINYKKVVIYQLATKPAGIVLVRESNG
jgi:hypothetical protein